MPRSDTASWDEFGKLCSKCGAREMRRTARTLLDRIVSVYPYKCGRCSHGERKARFTWRAIVSPVLFLLLAGGGIYAWDTPHLFAREEGRTNEAEALARARATAGGSLSSFEQMIIRKPKSTMDNAAVLQLWRANVGASVIVQMIHTTSPDYDVSANAIIELKQAGVDQQVILAMIDAGYNAR